MAGSSTTKAKKDETQEQTSTRFEAVSGFAKDLADAAQTGGQAYVGGLSGIGSKLIDFGKQLVADGSEHASHTLKAKNIRELTELQRSFAKHRIETANAHIRELTDITRQTAQEVVAPINELWENRAA